MNILNIQGYNIVDQKQTDIDYLFQVEVTPPLKCHIEGCNGTVLNRYGMKPQLYRDLPMHGKRVGIEVFRKRYQCKTCGKTFFENLPGMDEKRFMTKRLVEYVETQSLKRTFVRIDEIHILRNPRCVITNVKESTMIDILRDRDKKTVINYLNNLSCKQDIKIVCMDMWNPYKDAVKLILPHAQIIADKFHVIRMANQAIETIRKDLREEMTKKQKRGLMHDRFVLLKRNKDLKPHERIFLEVWSNQYPELGVAYELKESLFELWNSDINKQTARKKYDEWISKIPDSITYAFEPLLKAISNWNNEVFAYFDHRATNAYTEALNSLIRVIDRLGRGYSFDALRAKILYSNGVHKEEKPKYSKSNFEMREMDAISFSQFSKVICESPSVYGINTQKWNLGVDISTLVQKIEQGEFYRKQHANAESHLLLVGLHECPSRSQNTVPFFILCRRNRALPTSSGSDPATCGEVSDSN